jgi:hypothetical protein
MEQRLIITRNELPKTVFVVGFNDETESSRPFKVDVKFNRRSANGNVVGPKNRSDFFSECTLLVVIHLVLKVFQANSKFCIASSTA